MRLGSACRGRAWTFGRSSRRGGWPRRPREVRPSRFDSSPSLGVGSLRDHFCARGKQHVGLAAARTNRLGVDRRLEPEHAVVALGVVLPVGRAGRSAGSLHTRDDVAVVLSRSVAEFFPVTPLSDTFGSSWLQLLGQGGGGDPRHKAGPRSPDRAARGHGAPSGRDAIIEVVVDLGLTPVLAPVHERRPRTRIEEAEALVLSPRATLATARRAGITRARGDLRNCFQRDRDRIVHSKAFRRPRTKIRCSSPRGRPLPRPSHAHARVAQVARTIARPALTKTSSSDRLGHDVGHSLRSPRRGGRRGLPSGFRHTQSVRSSRCSSAST